MDFDLQTHVLLSDGLFDAFQTGTGLKENCYAPSFAEVVNCTLLKTPGTKLGNIVTLMIIAEETGSQLYANAYLSVIICSLKGCKTKTGTSFPLGI